MLTYILIAAAAFFAITFLFPAKKKPKSELVANPIQQIVYAQPDATQAPRRFSIRQQQIDEAAEVLAEEFSRAEDDAFRDAVRRKAANYFADALPAK